MVRFVRGFAFNLALTAGVLVGLAFLAKRFNVGGTIAEGALGLGRTAGQSLSLPFAGITQGLNEGLSQLFEGTGALGQNLTTAGADFQQFFTGNRNAIGDFFSGNEEKQPMQNTILPSNVVAQATQRFREGIARGTSRTDTSNIRQTSDLARLGVTANQVVRDPVIKQRTLEQLLEENRRKFPQFFS